MGFGARLKSNHRKRTIISLTYVDCAYVLTRAPLTHRG